MDFRGLFKATSYTEQAREVIKHLIFNGTYEPGDKLKEAELSRFLGISRSPVREAIQSLANDGLVRLAPQRGAFVSSFDLGEIKEIYEVREALEVVAARLAAIRADSEHLDKLKGVLEETRATLERGELVAYPLDLDFHQEISSLTRNRKLAGTISGINTQLQLARLKSASKPGRAREAYEEHIAIFQAIEEQAPERAADAMRTHLGNSLESMTETFDGEETGVA